MNEHQNKDAVKSKEHLSFEEQLLNYQKRIANILESFTDAFFEVDSNWTVTYWNKEAEKLLELPRQNIVGQNLWEVYAEAVPLKFYSEYHRAMQENIAVRFEEYFPPKEKWMEVAAFPSGYGLSVYFKDITDRKNATKKLQNERQKYIELFNLSPLPQWVYDLDNLQFLDVNEAAIKHYGYSRAEFMKMTLLDIRPTEDMDKLSDILCGNVNAGLFNKSTVRHRKKNGDIIHVCVEGNTVWSEGRNARLVMIIDRTAEIQAKRAMEESIKAIEEQNSRLREISWIQSHKIRSPLAKILGLVSLVGADGVKLTSIKELIPPLKASAEELDEVLKEIIKKT